MPIYQHTIDRPSGDIQAYGDKTLVGVHLTAANAAGAGATVATAVSFSGLPASYAVNVTPSQACFATVSGKTTAGFNVVLTPKDGSTTLSSGTFDVVVVA